jgi:proline dehydrogenase
MPSLNRLVVATLQLFPRKAIKPFALRYIAGETLADAVRVLAGLNAGAIMGTVDLLGENIATEEEARLARRASEEVLQAIADNHLEANLSIKLTQFGLKIDQDFCRQNVRSLLAAARATSNFVRLDMEDSAVTATTLRLYERLRGEGFTRVGVVIQAYLRRSEADLRRLLRNPTNLRLVKGIYVEPEAIAFQDREEIRRSYLRLLRLALDGGGYVAIATHDDCLVQAALEEVRERNLPRSAYEFQMLYGVRVGLRDRIVAGGHRLRVYVPYGRQWYAYSMRRFKENPRILRYVLQALFSPR